MRYDNGYSSYLAVLDAERDLFDVELLTLQVRAAAFSSVVGIYKAFGGGWVDALIPADLSSDALSDN